MAKTKYPKTQIDQAHRWLAVECNNRAWDLTAKAKRAPEESREMLLSACASVYHWSKVGKAVHQARGDLLLAHVHALLGHGDTALDYAKRCLAFFKNHDCEDWDMAFAQAEMAHAAAALGDAKLHAKHYALAEKQGRRIADEQDRQIFFQEFARIPKRVSRKR